MSIIGELYEDEWYEYRIERKEKLENYIKFVEGLKSTHLVLGDMRNAVLCNAIEELKEKFKTELK